jgi:hypothetical protein
MTLSMFKHMDEDAWHWLWILFYGDDKWENVPEPVKRRITQHLPHTYKGPTELVYRVMDSVFAQSELH